MKRKVSLTHGNDRVAATVAHLKEAAKNYEPSSYGGTGDSSNALFGFTTDEINSYTYPCHRHMKYCPADGVSAVFSMYCKPQSTQLDPEAHRRHFSWLVDPTISPWRSLLAIEPHSEFANEDFWWSNGFIFSNFLAMPANLIMNFFVATRMPKEWPQMISVWDDLVTKYNVDPALAYTALKLFNGSLSSHSKTRVHTINTADFYDWPLNNGTCSEEYVRNFCFGNPVEAKGTLGKKFESSEEPYGKINAVWGPTDCGFSSKKKPSYGRILYDLYSGELGGASQRKSTFSSDDDGETIEPKQNWALSFIEVIDLLHKEEERFKGNASIVKAA